jgi:DNA (cytosine-5)-methyltransferase 1
MIAPPITSNPYGDHESREGLLVAFGGNNQAGPIDVATACNAHGGPHGRLDFESETFVAHAFDARQSEALRARKPGQSEASTGTVIGGSAVRRLTPRECEKLQGFPADWTLVPYRGKPAADGPRYRAIGNSMAVPVVAWIGQRIRAVMEAMSGRRWVS